MKALALLVVAACAARTPAPPDAELDARAADAAPDAELAACSSSSSVPCVCAAGGVCVTPSSRDACVMEALACPPR